MLCVAQLLPPHQGVGALLAAGDAVAREHLAHHALDAFGGVVDLGHVFPQDPPGHVLRWSAWLMGMPSAMGCSQTRIQSVASMPGYVVWPAPPPVSSATGLSRPLVKS